MKYQTHSTKAEVWAQHHDGTTKRMTPGLQSISIHKNLYEPSGTWSICLLPLRDEHGKSWYYSLAPMDYVQIAFTRNKDKWLTMPPVMRGFIDSVNMKMSVDNQGKPNRTYEVTGRDYGKILEMTRIYYLAEIIRDVQVMLLPANIRLNQKHGANLHGRPDQIIRDIFQIAMGQLGHIRNTYGVAPEMGALLSTDIQGEVQIFSLVQEDGSVWDFMSFFDNMPWNELYVTDLPEGPTLVFRKTPWKDPNDGSLIQLDDPTYEKTLKVHEIKTSDIISMDLSRSDWETKNYFFTYPVQHVMGNAFSFKNYVLEGVTGVDNLVALPNPTMIALNDPDAGMNRFGFRRVENCTEYYSKDTPIAVPKELCATLNKSITQASRRNSAYEKGIIAIRGNEDIHPGHYVRMVNEREGGLTPEFYVVDIQHELTFLPGAEEFTTFLTVTRGDGFLKVRNRLDTAEIGQMRRFTEY